MSTHFCQSCFCCKCDLRYCNLCRKCDCEKASVPLTYDVTNDWLNNPRQLSAPDVYHMYVPQYDYVPEYDDFGDPIEIPDDDSERQWPETD